MYMYVHMRYTLIHVHVHIHVVMTYSYSLVPRLGTWLPYSSLNCSCHMDRRSSAVACSQKLSCSVTHSPVHFLRNADLVEHFGIESILIYTALLLKKRVVVYAPGLDTVMRVCR